MDMHDEPVAAADPWVPCSSERPHDDREVLVWGFEYGLAGGKEKCLGMSSYDRSVLGGRFECEAVNWFGKQRRVTHWCDVLAPSGRQAGPHSDVFLGI